MKPMTYAELYTAIGERVASGHQEVTVIAVFTDETGRVYGLPIYDLAYTVQVNKEINFPHMGVGQPLLLSRNLAEQKKPME